MLSVLYCSDYAGEDEAWLTLSREVKARELPPTGAPRILGIVAPYTGREIDPQRYCSRRKNEQIQNPFPPAPLIHSLLAIPKYVTIKKEAYREEDCP